MLFEDKFRNSMITRGLFNTLSAGSSVTVYKGVQPTAAQIIADWNTYKTAGVDCLAHYPSATWTVPNFGILMTLSTVAAVNADKTGVATWCIIWTTNHLQATIDGATLPSNSFIVGAVSAGAGDGVIRFSDTTFTSGVSKAILDGSIGSSITV